MRLAFELVCASGKERVPCVGDWPFDATLIPGLRESSRIYETAIRVGELADGLVDERVVEVWLYVSDIDVARNWMTEPTGLRVDKILRCRAALGRSKCRTVLLRIRALAHQWPDAQRHLRAVDRG